MQIIHREKCSSQEMTLVREGGDMNRMLIIVTAKPGKSHEVMAGLKTLRDYVAKKHNRKGELFMQIHGDSGTFYVINDYEDMASAEAFRAKIMADEEYWKMGQKFGDSLVGPPTITILQSL
jgi:quinol monooxygenase YgiN